MSVTLRARYALHMPIALLAICWAGHAAAAGHSARLVYVRAKDALACADEDGVRAAVAKRLGYDPFVGFAEMTLIVDVRRGATKGYAANLRVVHGDGVAAGGREIESADADCAALVDAMALTISIVVDPVTALRGSVAPSPAPSADPVASRPEPSASVAVIPVPANDVPNPPSRSADVPVPAPSVARRERVSPELDVAAFGSAGESAAVSAGAVIHAALRRRSMAIGLEARADLPSRHDVDGGAAIRSHSVTGWIVPCVASSIVEGCALVGAGAMMAESAGVSSARNATGVYFGVGARIDRAFAIGSVVVLRPFVDAVVQPFQSRYELDRTTVYRMPLFGVDAGVMVGVRFP